MRNDTIWFLAEMKFLPNDKFHIEHVICRLHDILDGIEFLSKNSLYFENGRILAILNDSGDTYVYWKLENDSKKPRQGWHGFFRPANLENDYDNCETLFPYMDEFVPYGEHGKIYWKPTS